MKIFFYQLLLPGNLGQCGRKICSLNLLFFWCQFCEDCLKIRWEAEFHSFRHGTSDWPDFLKVAPFSSEGSHSSVISLGIMLISVRIALCHWGLLLTWTWGNTKEMIHTSVTRKTELQMGEEDPGFLWHCPPHCPGDEKSEGQTQGKEESSLQAHWTFQYLLVFVDSFLLFRDTWFIEVFHFLLLKNLRDIVYCNVSSWALPSHFRVGVCWRSLGHC